MENKIGQLIDLVKKLPEDCLDETIEYVNKIIEMNKGQTPSLPCPHCKSKNTVKFGQMGGKQRYRCKDCSKTFVETTNTVMYYARESEAVWKQIIRDTIDGVSLDETAQSLDLSHATAFNMRHKILQALEDAEKRNPTELSGVCEIDDTFVLESLKGTRLPGDYWRSPRKHGAVAQKRGISEEYVSISTGIERDGCCVAKTVTRATPGKDDIAQVFGERISGDALILTDGAKSYDVLVTNCGCSVENVKEHEQGFYNINTVNGFHSFIKERYNKYRGVATKYLNRYNVLFAKSFRNRSEAVDEVYNILMSNSEQNYNSIQSFKTLNLLNV